MLQRFIRSAETSPLPRLATIVALFQIGFVLVQSTLAAKGTAGMERINDFDVFYLASQLVARGEIAQSYDLPTFIQQQTEYFGRNKQLTWSYPPPFDLIIAPLAWAPRWLSLAMFFTLTTGTYLLAVRKLSGQEWPIALLLLTFPVCCVILLGQNGLLTGTLAALAVIGLAQQRQWAGIPLGLLIIKPHLAVTLAAFVVIDRQWRTMAVAALTMGLAALAPELLIDRGIWKAFATGIANTASLLQGDFYSWRRMVSLYAALRSAAVPADVALAGQVIMAAGSLAAVVWAQHRLPRQQALGLAALLSLAISPYAFDYDWPVMATGLCLLLPAIQLLGRPPERALIYGLFLACPLYGIAHTFVFGPAITGRSPAGALHLLLLLLVVRLLARGAGAVPGPDASRTAWP
ncbi:glycosyltransferase family 87 protein [Sandarakinorhabdus rubra]|uniref:glycosyltransferase family 87 protein n=1 Tax=Sandarakinorhabdus rubra TaxID=2672568 RepID=UPI0013DCBD0B|nr:glycosyltransferase family 87 protein [Sandarakinorhabdus rubra]